MDPWEHPARPTAPEPHAGAATWIDVTGNLWLFGGEGADDSIVGECDKIPGPCMLNDLWKYSGGEWTWVGGSNVIDASGTYGTQGVAAPSNIPTARTNALTWTDAAGNFWLFGGVVTVSDFNDLWKYSSGEWTWMNGANQGCQSGIYGVQGMPSSSNVPSARDGSASFIDKAGNLWIFGGETNFCTGNNKLNDLWEYQP